MNVWEHKSRFWGLSRIVVILSLIAGFVSFAGCRNQNGDESADDRSPRQQLDDEFSNCPPLLPLDASKGGWELAPAAKYRAIGAGDLIMIRADGRADVTYDMTLAVGKLEPVAAVDPAPAPGAKPTTRKTTPAAPSAAPIVYLYRRPPASRMSGVKADFHLCGHLRSATPIGFISIRDADGFHSMAVEPADRPGRVR